jgi:hypothetical protein
MVRGLQQEFTSRDEIRAHLCKGAISRLIEIPRQTTEAGCC